MSNIETLLLLVMNMQTFIIVYNILY